MRGRALAGLPAGLLAGLLAAVLLGACSGEPAIPDWARATAIPADPVLSRPAAAGPPTGDTAAPTPAAAPPDAGPGADLGADLRITTAPAGQPVVVETVAGDRSWSIAVTATTPGDLVGIRRVVDPTGATRYLADLRNELLIEADLHPTVIADADAVGLYVTSPTGEPLPAGRWTVDVVANGSPPAVQVVVRSGDPTAPQVLDVVGWVTADVADPDAVAAAWRSQMDAVLAPHGITIGRLDLIPAGAAGQAYAALGVDGLADEVHRACTAAAAATGAPPRAALVVLASEIGEGVVSAYRQPDGSIDGFAVATPGTPVTGPASHACVAVRAGADPAARGLVALHEILHQAGLTRHTTERGGRDFDLLEDTPECPADVHDLDGDLQVSRGECADAGAGNLLFWAVGGTELTADQAWRVRAHPMLRPAG
jgi:hypothetical protein